MAGAMENHIKDSQLFKNGKISSEYVEKFRYQKAQYELRTNIARVMMGMSLK